MCWKTGKSVLINNITCYDFSDYKENAFVHFADKIIKVGHMKDYNSYVNTVKEENCQIIDGKDRMLLPGFVAAHTHIYSTFSRGMSIPFSPHSFQDILDQLWWKMDRQLDLESVYYSGLTSGMEFAKHGVTTIIDHHASGSIKGSLNELKKGVIDKAGIRGGFCFETSDRFDVEQCISENVEFMEFCKQDVLMDGNKKTKDTETQGAENVKVSDTTFGLFGLHASMSLSDDTLKKVKQTIGNAPIHIHVAESLEDQEHALVNYGKTVIERLNSFGLLNPHSILAHCIHITDSDMDLIKSNDCYVVVNVTSNMNNSVGLPNLRKLLDKGIKCMIGNDGMTSDIASEWRNTLFSMHLKTETPTGYSMGDLHQMITGGYEYVNNQLNSNIGKIKEGYESDLQMIDYKPYTKMNGDNVLGHLIFGTFHSFRPRHVWCGGNQLIYDYQLNEQYYNETIEELEKVPSVTDELWNRIQNN